MIDSEIEVNGKKYVLKDSIKNVVKATLKKGMRYVIVRTYSAGVFAGWLEKRNGKEAKLREARRLWYWKGAASLSQLAVDGVKYPLECKFSKPVDEEVTEVIEVIGVTEKAKKSISEVKEWEA